MGFPARPCPENLFHLASRHIHGLADDLDIQPKRVKSSDRFQESCLSAFLPALLHPFTGRSRHDFLLHGMGMFFRLCENLLPPDRRRIQHTAGSSEALAHKRFLGSAQSGQIEMRCNVGGQMQAQKIPRMLGLAQDLFDKGVMSNTDCLFVGAFFSPKAL